MFRNMFLKMQKIDAEARSSMADDFAAGRPTEIDYLNGEVVTLADALGRRRRSTRRSSLWSSRPKPASSRLWSGEELRAHVLKGAPSRGFGY